MNKKMYYSLLRKQYSLSPLPLRLSPTTRGNTTMNDEDMMYEIYKGNLSSALKQDILRVLTEMLDSDDSTKQAYAIDVLLKHKRDLSEWPVAFPEKD